MINIFITADYEVFLGENYSSYSDVLLKPALTTASLFASHNVSVSYFIDVFFIDYLKRNGFIDDYNNTINNIHKLYEMGHQIELHIHPHWLFVNTINTKYVFDKKYYALPKFSHEDYPFSVDEIVENAKRFLMDEIMNQYPDFQVSAFRAGGWSIQPEESIITTLSNNGIKIDSSVVRGINSGQTGMEYYDYRTLPDKDYWFISPSSGVGKEDIINQDMIELPVFSQGGVTAFAFKVLGTIRRKMTPQSLNITEKRKGVSCLTKKSKVETIKQYVSQPIRFSLDNCDDIPFYIHCLKKMSMDKRDRYICFFFHPKLITKKHLKGFEDFCEFVDKNDNMKTCALKDLIDLKKEV